MRHGLPPEPQFGLPRSCSATLSRPAGTCSGGCSPWPRSSSQWSCGCRC